MWSHGKFLVLGVRSSLHLAQLQACWGLGQCPITVWLPKEVQSILSQSQLLLGCMYSWVYPHTIIVTISDTFQLILPGNRHTYGKYKLQSLRTPPPPGEFLAPLESLRR